MSNDDSASPEERYAWEIATAFLEEQEARRTFANLFPRGSFLVNSSMPTPYVLTQRLKELTQTPTSSETNSRRPLLVEFFILNPSEESPRYAVFLIPIWEPIENRIPLRVVLCEHLPAEETVAGLMTYVVAMGASRYQENIETWRTEWARPENWEAFSLFPEGTSAEEIKNALEQTPFRDPATLRKETFKVLPSFLGKIFLQPWQHQLDSLCPTELIMVCNGFLHCLPLHIAELASGEWLIEKYPIVYLPAATLAMELLQMRGEVRSDLSRNGDAPLALVMGPPGKVLQGKYLQAAHQEALDTASKLREQGCYRVELRQGTDMTIDTLLKYAKDGGLRWIHLATHSQFNSDNLLESHILFHDEQLTLRQLMEDRRFHLPPIALWYQGSCESALTHPDDTDELMGFVRGLICAGAQSVMASLWPVDDDAGRRFAHYFYGYLIRPGTDRAQAYRAAILDVRRKFDNPYYCAPFALFGDAWSA